MPGGELFVGNRIWEARRSLKEGTVAWVRVVAVEMVRCGEICGVIWR